MTDSYCSSEILCSVIFVPLYQDYNVECCILEGTSFDCNFKVTTLNFESKFVSQLLVGLLGGRYVPNALSQIESTNP